MSGPDGASSLAADLSALPPRQRRDVLRALKPFERARLEALLRQGTDPSRAPVEPDEPRLPACSPWLTRRLREARQDGDSGSLTPAARDLLLQVAAAAAEEPAAADAPDQASTRSLAGAVLARLSRRGGGR